MWILEELFSLLAEQLETPFNDFNQSMRAQEALDALLIYGSEAREFSRQKLVEMPSPVHVSTCLVLGSFADDMSLVRDALDVDKSSESWGVIRTGMRLCNFPKVFLQFSDRCSDATDPAMAAILDATMFHRSSPNLKSISPTQFENPELRAIIVDAFGRGSCDVHGQSIRRMLDDTNAFVRNRALIAAARAGVPGLKQKCVAMAEGSMYCQNAVRFLGVLSTGEDLPLLLNLLGQDEVANAALEAMGRNGLGELIPHIVTAIGKPSTAAAAAGALERITGRLVPRSEPAPPPDHLSEDELDFWFHPGDPIPEAADRWWRDNHYYFENGKRYQAGVCVSDDPLGKHFDELPDIVRIDVYLRERALNPATTPDWELETWPRYVRNPTWASQG